MNPGDPSCPTELPRDRTWHRRIVASYVTSDGMANQSVWKRLSFVGFKEHKVVDLQRDLAYCKNSLTIAVTCASF